MTKTTPLPARLSVLIGHVIGVALRLNPFGKRKEADEGSVSGREMVEAKRVGVQVLTAR